jgi:hypothetical protein
VATNLIHDPGYDPSTGPGAPVEGLTIFAVFFVAAQALERLLEPLTRYYGYGEKASFSDKFDAAKQAVESAFAAYAALAKETDSAKQPSLKSAFDAEKAHADTALAEAAKAKAADAKVTGNKAIAFWAFACALGVLASSGLKLYFLKQVGVALPPRTLELLATGLIVGAGTKPLHDLVSLIEKKKESAAGTSSSVSAT